MKTFYPQVKIISTVSVFFTVLLWAVGSLLIIN